MKEKIIIEIETNKSDPKMIDIAIGRKSSKKLQKNEQEYIVALLLAVSDAVRKVSNPKIEKVQIPQSEAK